MGTRGGPYQCSRKNKLSRESTGNRRLHASPWAPTSSGNKYKGEGKGKPQYAGALKELETGLGGLEKDAMAVRKGSSPSSQVLLYPAWAALM